MKIRINEGRGPAGVDEVELIRDDGSRIIVFARDKRYHGFWDIPDLIGVRVRQFTEPLPTNADDS